jgi:hypothetical protein
MYYPKIFAKKIVIQDIHAGVNWFTVISEQQMSEVE